MIEKIKAFLTSPSGAFDKEKNTTVGDALKYFIVLLVIFSILNGLVYYLLPQPSFLTAFSGPLFVQYLGFLLIPISIILGLLGLLIGGLIMHVFVYIVGGRAGVNQTIKAFAYSDTPNLLLGWIPFIGVIFGLWSLVLTIIGIKRLHNISTGRAVLAVLLPIIILLFIIFALALFALGVFSPVTFLER